MEKVKTNMTTRTMSDIGKSQATAHCSAEMPGTDTPSSLGPLPSGVRPSPAKRTEADSPESTSQPILLTDAPASLAGDDIPGYSMVLVGCANQNRVRDR